MTSLTEEDEALIQRFIGLHTDEKKGSTLKVPSCATTNTDWSMCLLSRVISDRTAIEGQFQIDMMKAWDADPRTSIRSVAKNSFLIEFYDPVDLQTASQRGPWTFKGDLVALKTVSSNEDINPAEVRHAQIWVQLFHIPLNAFTDEGLIMVAKEVGVPVSAPIEGFVSGKRFYKVKVTLDLSKPIKDKVKVTHPTLGELIIFCVFEKVSRICVFCGHLGHVLGTCADHHRLSTILSSPEGVSRASGHKILDPTRGPWITNVTQIPKVQPTEKRGLKRQSAQTGSNCSGQELGPNQTSQTENLNFSVAVLERETAPVFSSSQENLKRPKSAGQDPLTKYI